MVSTVQQPLRCENATEALETAQRWRDAGIKVRIYQCLDCDAAWHVGFGGYRYPEHRDIYCSHHD